jgi:hypothetical protein
MDWEYQNTGPVDASSPFTKISQQPRACECVPPVPGMRQGYQTARASYQGVLLTETFHSNLRVVAV